MAALLLADCGKNQTHTVLPPKQYDRVPIVPFIDVRLPYWTVDGYCRAHANLSYETGRIEGCAIVMPGARRIRVVPLNGPDISAAEVAAIIRHENGHLNGWPANHPGGHY